MLSKIKGFFSKAGQAFMLPIALLPAAGILLGIGKSFTNPTFLAQYPNLTFIQKGTILYNILDIMGVAGDIIFANLPLLFAIGLAVGFAKKEKGAAALSALIGYFVMLVVAAKVISITNYDPNFFNLGFLDIGLEAQTNDYISNFILNTYNINGFIEPSQITNLINMPIESIPPTIEIITDNGTQVVNSLPLYEAFEKMPLLDNQITMLHQPGALTNTLNIENTLSMGVFGGIISGMVSVWLHNKFIDLKLPAVLGFFGGPRLIPILAAVFGIILGTICAFIWPFFGTGLSFLGDKITSLGSFGSLLFGLIERALIPLGLHHVFYTPLWQTAVGGSALIDVNGTEQLVFGTQNIFFANLSAGTLEQMSSTNYMTGKFPFMIFGLPGAALAMYSVALPKNKKVIGGMLLSVAFTAMLTGITEPIEFTFLFLAPFLYYGIHVPLAGLSFFLMDILNVKIGMTFSGGLIDYTMFGILPQVTGQNVNAWNVILVGIPYFFIYFFIFRFFILKFNIQTPGRGDDLTLKTKKDFQEKQNTKNENGISEISLNIIEALGGKDNIKDIDACITRLRVTVNDPSKVKDNNYWINNLNAKGLVANGNGFQIIYGDLAKVYKSEISNYLNLE